MYNVLSSVFNALGRSRIPLYLLIFSSLFNILLDIYFVYILHLGVAGVAWATFIAQGISAGLSFFIFLKELRAYQSEKTSWFSASAFVSMTRIALPSILQQSTVSIGMMPVSYTHLDVYKRQIYNRHKCLPGKSYTCSHFPESRPLHSLHM